MIYESSDGSNSLYWARLALLQEASKVEPAVLNDLRGLLPLFRETVPYLKGSYGDRTNLWAWYITKSSRPKSVVLKFRNALVDWAQKYHLNFEWSLAIAIRSLETWDRNIRSVDYGWFYTAYSYFIPIQEDERKFLLELPGWRTDYETQAAFTKRANKDFREYLDAYITRIKALLVERDHIPAKRKYEPLVEGYDDFRLLALRLVCRRSYQDILSEVVAAQTKAGLKKHASYNAVESRIRRTAELCMINPALLKRAKKNEGQ